MLLFPLEVTGLPSEPSYEDLLDLVDRYYATFWQNERVAEPVERKVGMLRGCWPGGVALANRTPAMKMRSGSKPSTCSSPPAIPGCMPSRRPPTTTSLQTVERGQPSAVVDKTQQEESQPAPSELLKREAGAETKKSDSEEADSVELRTNLGQRRLTGEETTFQAILDSTRESLARHYLAKSEMLAGEISCLLGYDDPRSFYRAFRAWARQDSKLDQRPEWTVASDPAPRSLVPSSDIAHIVPSRSGREDVGVR